MTTTDYEKTIPQSREWLSYSEAETVSGISKPTLRRWARLGKIKVSRLSATAVKIHRDELARLMSGGLA